MGTDVVKLLQAQGGAASVAQLRAARISRQVIDAAVRAKDVTRVRRDALVLTSALRQAPPWERKRLTVSAVGLSLAPAHLHLGTTDIARDRGQDVARTGGGRAPTDGGLAPTDVGLAPTDGGLAPTDVGLAPTDGGLAPKDGGLAPTDGGLAVSHGSALRLLALRCYGDDDLVHMSRIGSGKGRRDGIVWVHAPVPAHMVVPIDGIVTVVPALAALQVAATYDIETGIVAVDGVLHRAEVVDAQTAHAEGREPDPFGWRRRDPHDRPGPARAELDRQLAELLDRGFGKATSKVRSVVAAADGRSESTGESRARWTITMLGLGPATPQFTVWDGPTLIGVADLKLDAHKVLIEFDGLAKYAAMDDLLAEKWREDRLRDLGYQVVRITWADLARPHVIRERVLAAIARSRV